MMYINGHWETVDTLEDVVKIIRENYSEELADKMDELLEQMFDAYNNRIEELTEQIYTYDYYDYDYDDNCED